MAERVTRRGNTIPCMSYLVPSTVLGVLLNIRTHTSQLSKNAKDTGIADIPILEVEKQAKSYPVIYPKS